jgi:hypothetical protein
VADYRKYAYWLPEQEAMDLKARLEATGRSVVECRQAVCSPLSKRIDIGMVTPETWRIQELCRRPLSWYWVSSLAGRYLMVSGTELTEFGLRRQIVLNRTTFKPPRLPTAEEKARLLQRPSYQNAKPEPWDCFDQAEIARQKQWMRQAGIRVKSFQELFLTHCANHANFIEPEFYVRTDEGRVPYSIAPTKEICSACLEMFNVLGSGFRLKYVVPCPGAAMYAGLAVNRYIAVESTLP